MPYLYTAHHDSARINKHYDLCEKSQDPYVICQVRGTKADVIFDIASLDQNQRAVLDVDVAEIAKDLGPLIARHTRLKDKDLVSAHDITIRDLPIEPAKALAEDLFNFYAARLRKTKRDFS
ncbi:hypothetical protein RM190_23060 [Paracoccus sp. CPCC 101403]|uniref:Uncharacterized protein n=1 Tax=Paracoccus broussonetiae TaxID=3075834 RepID=A0ABU3EKH8_9RHOB|nr:hypothetical protein [Paracoccus sp. CPCC 101403]MDT1064754.1 hypothetical protein [Paracoccus sp. CPCC 101403]